MSVQNDTQNWTGNVPAHGQNDQQLKDLLSKVRDDARNKAKSDRSKAVMYGRVLEAAVGGVIDTTKDKHGKNIDDAKLLYDEFIKAYSDKDPNSHAPKGVAVQVSRLRTAPRYAEFCVQQGHDAMTEFSRYAEIYKNLRSVNEGKDVKPEFEAYYKAVCTAMSPEQNGLVLSDDQIAAACRKAESEEKDLLKVLQELDKKVTGLVTGENKQQLKDQSESMIAIQAALHEYVRTLELLSEEQAAHAKLAEIATLRSAAA